MGTSLKKVRLWNGKWTYQRSDGTFLDAKGFYYIEPFNDKGLALVRRHRKGNWNFLKQNGMLVFDNKGLDYIEPFDENGFARVRRRARRDEDGVWNYLRSDGVVLLSYWLEGALRFKDGYALVLCYKGAFRWYYIDINGRLHENINRS